MNMNVHQLHGPAPVWDDVCMSAVCIHARTQTVRNTNRRISVGKEAACRFFSI